MTPGLTQRDVFWGYAAKVLSIATGLILLPLVVRLLSPEEVGLWFVFLALAALAQLMELGLQPTIARNAAYVYSGAQHLRPVGLTSASAGAVVNVELLADLFASARRIYFRMAIAAALVLLAGGSAYLYSLLPPGYPVRDLLPGWLAFALGYIITFFFGFYSPLLQGRGDVTAANQIVVASRTVQVACGALALVFGFGLLGLGLASLCSSVVDRFLAFRYFFDGKHPETHELRRRHGAAATLVGTLWHNASRLGLVNLAAFLILRASVLVASTFLGLTAAARYGLSLQLLLALSGVASMFATLQLPRMNALQVSGQREALQRSYGLTVLSAWVMFGLGAFMIVAWGDSALAFIGSHTPLIGMSSLACLSLILLLEMNHSISALYLTTLNSVPFVRAALWSGAATVAISTMLVATTDLGIWGLILGQGIVQASYNNWKWPKEALANLGCTMGDLMRAGLTQLGLLLRGTAH